MTAAGLEECCGSTKWVSGMMSRIPFPDSAAMHAAADEIWWSLEAEDWLEAFSKHPRIGQQANARWSAEEQRGMNISKAEIAIEMEQWNAAYYSKFGFIFIVCATGKSGNEMLALVKKRLEHSRDKELKIAAAEQAKITHLRLDKLVAP